MNYRNVSLILMVFLLLGLSGAVSAADLGVSGSVIKTDLTVTAITPNSGGGNEMFANETNVISVTVANAGAPTATNFVVSVDVGGNIYTTNVASLAGGASTTVTVTDTVLRTGGASVSITATADSTGVVAETNEANNALTVTKTVYNNGNKGKRWTGGSDMNTQAGPFTGHINVVYSRGNSAYNSAGWTEKTYSWSPSDLPIPDGATIVSARLYQGYTWDQTPGGSPLWTMTFNGNTVTPVATYTDRKGYGTNDYPQGLVVYDVTSHFNPAGNSMTITAQAGNNNGIYGAFLVVVYEKASEKQRKIWINDECDILYSGTARSVSNDEAIAYANFAGVSTESLASAKAIAILQSANENGKSKFFFNTQEYTGFWPDYQGTPQIGFSVYDVTSAIVSGANEARLQSYDSGSSGDNMYATNVILVTEYQEAPVADFTATPLSGDRPLTVQFTDASTGSVTGWAWDFDNDGTTDSTLQNPSYTYTTAGYKTVKLTVTGPLGSDSETKTDYIHVKEPAPVAAFSADKTSGPSPLTVQFTDQSTGVVNSWAWDFDNNGVVDSNAQNPSHTYATPGTYTVKLTVTGPDYSDDEVKENYISVGEATISVSVSPSSIDFGTMVAGVDETGSSTVSVDVTGGTGWSVTASANNGGYMKAGALQLADAFQLSNGGAFQYMTSNFGNFLTGNAGEDKSGPANVKQVISSGDQPGEYSITLTFTGAFV
jgi:PKD repeat protein